jgi:hypothetical protein
MSDDTLKNTLKAMDQVYDILAGAFDERKPLDMTLSERRAYNKFRYKINELVDLMDDYENMVEVETTKV